MKLALPLLTLIAALTTSASTVNKRQPQANPGTSAASSSQPGAPPDFSVTCIPSGYHLLGPSGYCGAGYYCNNPERPLCCNAIYPPTCCPFGYRYCSTDGWTCYQG
ncbi:hypothetical protein DFH27DRAFT_585691 [Peziza echinospora]|nr:hypothetical protein DFH27DRAFT_585691 [Peziza echinospora]